MWSALQKPFPKASQEESCSVITGYSLQLYPMVCLEDCSEPSLLRTSFSELLLETEWGGIVFNANSFQSLFGFFCNQKLKSDLSRELVGHCDPGDQLQLRIMYLGYMWFGERGKLGFENKSSIVIYMQTISKNHLCSKFVKESKMWLSSLWWKANTQKHLIF